MSWGIAYADRLTWASDADLAAALDDALALGAGWVRHDLSWYDLQPDNATTYRWDRSDRWVTAALARGLKVLGTLAYAPPWARGGGTGWSATPPTDPAAYAKFAGAVAARYKGRVAAYELWNEPNSPAFWATPDPARYAALYAAGAKAVRAADPAATLLLGGLTANDGTGGSIRPGVFLDAAMAAGAADFDAVAYHPYTYPHLASEVTTWRTPWERITTDVAGGPALTTVLRNRGSKAAVWLTEFGAPTQGPAAVTEQQQAAIVLDGIATAKAQGLGGLFIHTDRDPAAGGSEAYGLRRADGTPKAAYAALASPVTRRTKTGVDATCSRCPGVMVLWRDRALHTTHLT
jgi:hypothetical protein